jgi:hypothetical protein
MRKSARTGCSRITWKNRDGYALENDLVRLVTLTGGGHIAEFRFRSGLNWSTVNPLWDPPWKTIEPQQYNEKKHAKRYGPMVTGKTVGSTAGHSICLDYFGPPSPEETAQGLSIHGEAPGSRWRATRIGKMPARAVLEMSVQLPVAGLHFSRQITLRQGESVAYFKEKVTNLKKSDHFFHWTQHVTLGPPFLHSKDCRTYLPGTKGITYPLGYEGKELLQIEKEFQWPFAPGMSGGKIDISKPLTKRGRGYVASVLLKPDREMAYVAALNTKEHLIIGYCFKRTDFPWVAIWEENRARKESPWSGISETRGLEFGSTPIPIMRRDAYARGPLFGTPHFSVVPAKSLKTASYLTFLTPVPNGFTEIRDIEAGNKKIMVIGRDNKGKEVKLKVPAAGLRL